MIGQQEGLDGSMDGGQRELGGVLAKDRLVFQYERSGQDEVPDEMTEEEGCFRSMADA